MMKVVVLSNNQQVLVSDEDYDYVCQFNWHDNDHAAYRVLDAKHSKMHKEIALRMGLRFKMIDHKDQNPYNNQRDNLRPTNHSTNAMNMPAHSDKIYSNHKGVTYDRKNRKWKASICKNRHIHNIGRFDTENEAALAYNVWAIRLFGEFASLNEVI